MIEKIKDSVDGLNDSVHSYGKSTYEYYKLSLFKKSMKTTVSLSRVLLLGSVALLFLFFLSFGVALWLGELLGNASYGFFIVAGVFLILFILAAVFGKNILERKILTSGSKIFFND